MPALGTMLRRAAAGETLALPFSIPSKESFTFRELADLSGMSESYVEKKFDEGTQLSGHVHNGGKGERMSKRVPRAWAICWLIATAQYDDESLADAFVAALRRLPVATLERIARAATELATAKKFSPGQSGILRRAV